EDAAALFLEELVLQEVGDSGRYLHRFGTARRNEARIQGTVAGGQRRIRPLIPGLLQEVDLQPVGQFGPVHLFLQQVAAEPLHHSASSRAAASFPPATWG